MPNLGIGHQCRGTAEITEAANLVRIKNGNRLAALAADGSLLGLPASRVIGDTAESAHQVVFDDCGFGAERLECGWRLRTAERAYQRLPGGIPVGFRAAGRTMKFLAGCCYAIGIGHDLLEELGQLRPRDSPLRPDALALEVARLQAGDDIRFGYAERFCSIGRTEKLR